MVLKNAQIYFKYLVVFMHQDFKNYVWPLFNMQKKVKQWDILVRKILIIEYLTFHDRGSNHKETSPQICRANQ